MEERDLIKRVQSGDGSALRAFYAAYAEPVYEQLLSGCKDRELARQMLKDVFGQAQSRLKAGDDLALLYLEALSLIRLRENAAHAPPQEERTPDAYGKTRAEADRRAAREETEAKPPARRAARTPAFLLTTLLLVALLWVGAGLLMKMRVLPHSSLGYEWFNAHIFPLF